MNPATTHRRGTRPRPTLAGGLLALAVALAAQGCSGDGGPDDPDASVPAQATDGGARFQIETRTTVGRVVGKLSGQERERVSEAVTEVVQRWFDAAYVGGEYPRSDFGDAYPGFTPGAADEARRDKRLMTNVGIGDRIEGVTPTTSRLRLDVLAPQGNPAGVTARFQLKFRTEGDLERKVRIKGRLMLTRQQGGWRIFGYDVSRGGRA